MNTLLSVRLVTRLITLLLARFPPWCLLINYLLSLQGCLPHILHRKDAATCAKLRRVHHVRVFHGHPGGEVASSLHDIKGGVHLPAANRRKVSDMQFIVTSCTGTKRGATYKVRFFTPEQGRQFEGGESKRGQLHATEGGENGRGAGATERHTPKQQTQTRNPRLFETTAKTNDHDREECKTYEQSLHKKNIHAILLCGGIGQRTELASRKQFLKLNDVPLFIYSFNLFVKCNLIKAITLVCDPNYFQHVIESINRHNASLLRRKHQRGFLRRGHSKNVLASSGEQSEGDASGALHFLKKNKYILYDNEKGKCVTNLDELLSDVTATKGQYVSEVDEVDEVKPGDVNSNRYKLIRLVESGRERADSLLNALRGLDLRVQTGEYISQLLRGGGTDEAGKGDGADKGDKSDGVDGGHPADCTPISHILVHDGARPFLSELDLFNLIYMATIGRNAILGSRATDTIKRIGTEQQGESCPRVKAHMDRQFIFAAQTPQIFSSQALLQVCAKLPSRRGGETPEGSRAFTDTSSLFQHVTKKKVFALQAKFPNFKITTPTDVFLAIFLMGCIFKTSHSDVDMGMFKETFVNSPSSCVPANQLNDHFFYHSLGGKQRVLYRHFYYE
ncbi:2-C-methyl-D-erythritol 4-phosphate cytidylyltransferase, putative [Plasmodium vivax]|uniref:2-C-methyl-D-erythritol 4-phosphate cytidylyltransferase, putative n=1 Tax=Plasmodium vivax TaxID=5855 RepID=A0A1G4GRC3_PLAVI|nr:2-C-methyl-D-erythritol 4-phosphate cytidylyltransferase, putative [Plasmodium vivax]